MFMNKSTGGFIRNLNCEFVVLTTYGQQCGLMGEKKSGRFLLKYIIVFILTLN